MKPLLVEILESILSTDEKLAYVITCDEEELVGLTRDTSISLNLKLSVPQYASLAEVIISNNL